MMIDNDLANAVALATKANTGRTSAEEQRMQTILLLVIATRLGDIAAAIDKISGTGLPSSIEIRG